MHPTHQQNAEWKKRVARIVVLALMLAGFISAPWTGMAFFGPMGIFLGIVAMVILSPFFVGIVVWQIDRLAASLANPSDVTGRSDHCEHCDYNLTGNTSGICPECGQPVTPAHFPD